MADEATKKRLKAIFDDWMEIEDQKKELSASSKQVLEEASQILDKKKTIVGKVFRFMKKRVEDGIDEIDMITDVMSQIE